MIIKISINFILFQVKFNNCQFRRQVFMMKRKGVVETQRKKKISLPAALFNRSPLKNTQNSSMISNTSFTNEPPCENHPNKRGKYSVITEQIEDDEETYYCEKCAILLASKGFEVKKLEFTDAKTIEIKKSNPRQKQLSDFLARISDKIKNLKEIKKQSAQYLSEIEENFQDKVQKIQQFFEELYATLEKHKNKQIHEAGMRKKSSQEELATHLGYLTEKIELLETMKEDIESSHDSIVKQTPEEDYQLVMSHYQTNLGQIKTESLSPSLADLSLPSMQSIENLLAEIFESGRSGTYFSFDSSKKPYE